MIVRLPMPEVDHLRPGFIRSWMYRIPLVLFLPFATLFAAVLISVTVLLATQVMWFGLELEPDQNGIRVINVAPDGPSANILAKGDLLIALRDPHNEALPLTADSLTRQPQRFSTFKKSNIFTAQQELLFSAIAGGIANFILADGREVRVKATVKRPVSDLPLQFWAMTGACVFVLLVGVGIWTYSPGQTSTRLLALGSIAYLLAGLCLSIIGTREWLIEPELFRTLAAANSLGTLFAIYCLVVLLWYYPKPLGNFPMATTVLPFIILVWANNNFFQIVELPLHTHRFPRVISLAFIAWLAYKQWYVTRESPYERSALLWYLLSLMVGSVFLFTNYLLPYLYPEPQVASFWACELRIFLLYVGLILGVLHFRLFDLDRWWFVIWTWFFAGVLVVMVDFSLVYYTHLNKIGALSLSLLVMGWVYFPMRQWVWSRFVRSPSEQLESHLPHLLKTFFSASDSRPLHDRWRLLLTHVFEPLSVRVVPGSLKDVLPNSDGLVLAVPDIESDRYILLFGRSRGHRVFNRDDVQLGALLLTLARNSAALREAQERGAAVERERIARDLHDDVASQLLTLAHSAESPQYAERARAALQTLRETIYTLSEPGETSLETTLAEWRIEVAERTEAAGVRLEWHQPQKIPELSLTTRQRLNLVRVLREAVTNALWHAFPSSLEVTIAIKCDRLSMRVIHDGKIDPPESWRAGRGLSNMRKRIAELGGHIEWHYRASSADHLEISWDSPVGVTGNCAITAI